MDIDSFPQLDESQRKLLSLGVGYHLVLAPPGCGKTTILADRVKDAHAKGIDYADMLCLTFTNRAAREMLNRISSVMKDDDISSLMVGNIHRFCSKYLFSQQLVPADTSIIDDEESMGIIADFLHCDENVSRNNHRQNKTYQSIMFFSHLMFQIEKHHPINLYLHPEILTEDDRIAVKLLCKQHNIKYSQEGLVYIYQNADDFLTSLEGTQVILPGVSKVRTTLLKMIYSRQYHQYKEQHHMFDFEDLLLQSYEILKADDDHKRFSWIQVDEVQDLNAMQLAIIDLLSLPKQSTVVYLGDEQQAIFSFMGAKVERLTELKLRCKDHVYHLVKNHRSPSYLLNVFNDFAEKQLHIDRSLLPMSDNVQMPAPTDMQIIYADTTEEEIRLVAEKAQGLKQAYPQQTTAIVVNTNAEAERISQYMERLGVHHFKISGSDLFLTDTMRLLIAHLSVLANENSQISWVRLLKLTKVFDTYALARRFVWKLRSLALTPSDLLMYDGSSYLNEFVSTYNSQTLVVFDTETTGLDVLTDDIIEISAMKVRNGQLVGEPLDLYIKTDKVIPQFLGDKPNPLYTIYQEKQVSKELIDPQKALQLFMSYVGDSVVVGHNVRYDREIFRNNYQRHCHVQLDKEALKCFDTLKLTKLLDPSLCSYKLESLLAYYHLEGVNSHRSIDDVDATVHLLNLCASKAQSYLEAQRAFLAHPKVTPFIHRFKRNYLQVYLHGVNQLYDHSVSDVPMIVDELRYAHQALGDGLEIKKVDRLEIVCNYIQKDMMADDSTPNVLQYQLAQYIMDLNTIKESDFCNSKSCFENIYISTIHKAKGLEFDNVIVFDAVDGKFPSKYNRTDVENQEDARKFYVAISRAKQRLFIAYSMHSQERHGKVVDTQLTPFMNDISRYFS